MKKRIQTGLFLYFAIILILPSCSTSTPSAELQQITVYATSAASPWLAELYDCAGRSLIVIHLSDSPSTAEVRLQIGEPEYLTSFAYQIDEEEILIVTNRQSSVQNLTLEEAQAIFTGLSDPSVQVWVYSSGDDVFRVFDQFVMKGRIVSSSARVALDPQQMSDTLNSETNAIGILPRHWKAGSVREVFSVAKVPVLALTQSEPQGAVNQLIGCLQK